MSGTERLAADAAGVARAAELLRAGRVVALPTETVYGLAARADDPAAVRRIFAAKGRPPDNPLIVHVPDPAAVTMVAATLTPLARDLLARFAPGPLTVVLPARGDLPRGTTGGLDTVAVRIPDHPLMQQVLAACGLPLAAPSANRSGRPSPTTAAHVLADLDGRVDAVLDGGPTRIGLESTVVDTRGDVPVVLRDGAVTREDLGLRPFEPDDAAGSGSERTGVRAPGTRHPHYAPALPVHVLPAATAGERAAALAAAAGPDAVVGLIAPDAAAGPGVRPLGRPADAAALGAALFGLLRSAEEAGLTAVAVAAVPPVGIGRAVMDRLHRAAVASGGEDLVGGASA